MSNVNSSLKSFANSLIWSLVTSSPLLIFWMKSLRASALAAFLQPFFSLMFPAISSTVSCRCIREAETERERERKSGQA